jgi:hypothetical protein
VKTINHVRMYRLLHQYRIAGRTLKGDRQADRMRSIARQVSRLVNDEIRRRSLVTAAWKIKNERRCVKRYRVRQEYRQSMMEVAS